MFERFRGPTYFLVLSIALLTLWMTASMKGMEAQVERGWLPPLSRPDIKALSAYGAGDPNPTDNQDPVFIYSEGNSVGNPTNVNRNITGPCSDRPDPARTTAHLEP